MKGQISKPSADAVYFAFNHVEGGRNVTFQNGTDGTITVEVTNQNIQRTGLSGATWSTPANGSTVIPVDAVKGIIGPNAFVRLSGTGTGSIYYAYTEKDDGIIELFTPSKLFANGEQGVWYDPSDLSTLFQDAAGTTPVTSAGDPVGLMLDKSGNGNHATQTTSAARPTYQTDGTYHWLEGDGVDDYLRSSILPTTVMEGGGFMSTAWRYLGGGLQFQGVFEEVSSSLENKRVVMYCKGSDDTTLTHSAYASDGTARAITTTAPAVGTDNISSLSSNGTQAVGYLNSNLIGSPVDSTSVYGGSTVLELFRQQVGARYAADRIYGAIAVDRELLETERQNTEQYLASKSGATIA